MNQSQMIALRGKTITRKSSDEILKDIMIALMIAAAISLLMCYLPMIVDAATKKGASSGGEGIVTNVVNALSKGIYGETVGVARPLAVVCFGICAVCHFGYPGSALDRKLQGWPMRIIIAFCVIALAPTILDYLEQLLKQNGLFTWK